MREMVPGASGRVTAWPASDSFDGAFIRLPKAKEAVAMALHAAAARLPAGAPIVVFGGNREGMRSLDPLLGQVAGDTVTVAARHHSRVEAGARLAVIQGLKGALADWRRVGEIAIDGVSRPWVSYPGTFAKGGLDDGTELLIGHLPPLASGVRVLDYAAGTGPVAAAIAGRAPGAAIDMVDRDSLALAAARENVPGATAIVGDRVGALGDRRYELIVSNPPIHDGFIESRTALDRLIAEAPQRLRVGGRFVIVVQRRIAVMAELTAAFGGATVLADNGRFTVVMAQRVPQSR
jgi:16S rRNA (guanine1207-N2)-methyltransferase